jgi:hypothetical protein
MTDIGAPWTGQPDVAGYADQTQVPPPGQGWYAPGQAPPQDPPQEPQCYPGQYAPPGQGWYAPPQDPQFYPGQYAPVQNSPGQYAQAQMPGAARTPEQLAYERGQQDMRRKLTTPRMTGYRIACGICWAFWTLLCGIGAIVSLAHGGVGTFFIGAILAGLAGWYDWRIWTLRARRLTFLIIF